MLQLCRHRNVTLIPLLVSWRFRIVASVETAAQELSIPAEKSATGHRRRTAESAIRAFFGSNALVAIVVLTLITIFLFREGFGFFGQNLANLRLYRQAGLEYVDIIRSVSADHEALSRKLNEIRLQELRRREKQSVPLDEINASLASFDQFASGFSDTAEGLRGLVSDLTDQASALKEQLFARNELLTQKIQLEKTGNRDAAAKLSVPQVNQAAAL